MLSILYIYHGLSQVEIADLLGCADCTVSEYRRKYNIERRYKDADWLRKQYHERGLTLAEVADKAGCDLGTVADWMERHGIKRRSISESRSKGDVEKLHNKEWLRREYIERERTTTDIAEELEVTTWVVSVWLRRHEIKARPSLSATGSDNPNWAGGYEKYYGSDWESQRKKAIQRDGGECQVCGSKNIHVHHIRPFRTFGLENHEKANELDNLICLCPEHHGKWEGVPLRPQ